MSISRVIINDIKNIIVEAKNNAIRTISHHRTMMYWRIGKRIFEEEQEGKDRADYGKFLTKYISEELEPEYSTGFSKRQIEIFRQFYRTFPIANTLYSQLSWSQYKILIRLDNKDNYHY